MNMKPKLIGLFLFIGFLLIVSYVSNYVNTYGYSDMFLIYAPHGHVMFTVAQEADWGTNLEHGPYKGEVLAHLPTEPINAIVQRRATKN